MQSDQQFFVGMDLGTGGVRALAVSETGEVAAAASVPLGEEVLAPQEDRHEQPPRAWLKAVCQAASALVAELKTAGVARSQLAAMAIDGTSGTLGQGVGNSTCPGNSGELCPRPLGARLGGS